MNENVTYKDLVKLSNNVYRGFHVIGESLRKQTKVNKRFLLTLTALSYLTYVTRKDIAILKEKINNLEKQNAE